MSEPDPRCGTCKHYTPDIGIFGGVGLCGYPLPPLPDAMPCGGQEMMLMGPKCGTTCPCWAAVENGEVGA